MKGLPLSYFSYSSMQQIFFIPACFITFAQLKHGQYVVQRRHPSVLPMPTSIIADYYAWRQRHWSSCLPQFLLHRSHPILQQDGICLGVPLYPVETTRFSSLTMTAPTEAFIQFDLLLAISAIFMKYWSHVGLKYRRMVFSLRLISSRSSSFPLFKILTRTSSKHCSYSSLCDFSSISINSLIVDSDSYFLLSYKKLASRCLKVVST